MTDVFAQVGMVMLVGLASKNAILSSILNIGVIPVLYVVIERVCERRRPLGTPGQRTDQPPPT